MPPRSSTVEGCQVLHSERLKCCQSIQLKSSFCKQNKNTLLSNNRLVVRFHPRHVSQVVDSSFLKTKSYHVTCQTSFFTLCWAPLTAYTHIVTQRWQKEEITTLTSQQTRATFCTNKCSSVGSTTVAIVVVFCFSVASARAVEVVKLDANNFIFSQVWQTLHDFFVSAFFSLFFFFVCIFFSGWWWDTKAEKLWQLRLQRCEEKWN